MGGDSTSLEVASKYAYNTCASPFVESCYRQLLLLYLGSLDDRPELHRIKNETTQLQSPMRTAPLAPMASLLHIGQILKGHNSTYTLVKELHRAVDEAAVYLVR